MCQAKNSLGESDPVSTEIDVKCTYPKLIADIFTYNIKFHKSFRLDPARVLWVGPEPSVQATLFTRVVLECRAEGNPQPRYLWTHALVTNITDIQINRFDSKIQKSNDYRPLEATDAEGGMPVGRDAMLLLHNVTYRQQGSYRCTATNTIGGRERWHTADPLTMAVVCII